MQKKSKFIQFFTLMIQTIIMSCNAQNQPLSNDKLIGVWETTLENGTHDTCLIFPDFRMCEKQGNGTTSWKRWSIKDNNFLLHDFYSKNEDIHKPVVCKTSLFTNSAWHFEIKHKYDDKIKKFVAQKIATQLPIEKPLSEALLTGTWEIRASDDKLHVLHCVIYPNHLLKTVFKNATWGNWRLDGQIFSPYISEWTTIMPNDDLDNPKSEPITIHSEDSKEQDRHLKTIFFTGTEWVYHYHEGQIQYTAKKLSDKPMKLPIFVPQN